MKKQLNKWDQVAHFYLGVDMECVNKKLSSDLEYYGMRGKLSSLLFDKYVNGNWKPRLRPLDSMTQEEQKEFRSLNTSRDNKEQCEANNTVWLLKKHFDLFNLIRAGLAIDKTNPKI